MYYYLMIEHIVINGGGSNGLINYGALKYLEQKEFWNIKNIKSIHGTSVGAIIAVLLSLKYDWDTLDNYIIKRPWDKEFDIKIEQLISINENKALMDTNIYNIFFEKLLDAKELTIDITLKEFYEWNNIDIHFYCVELTQFEKVNINYETNPDLKLIDAIKMTSAIPLFFPPVIIDDKIYIDGGLMCNYPIKDCIEYCDNKLDTILAFKNYISKVDNNEIDKNMNFLGFISYFSKKIINYIQIKEEYPTIPCEVKCLIKKDFNYIEWFQCFSNKEKRIELLDIGRNNGELFYQYYNQLHKKN